MPKLLNKYGLVLVLSATRPVFYFISPTISRLSDIAVLFAVFFVNPQIFKIVRPFLLMQLSYLFVICLSITTFVIAGGDINGKDLIELSRPFFWIGAALVGAGLVQSGNIHGLLKLLLGVAILNSALCILMAISPTLFKPLYVIYSVPNLFYHGRPGGLAYTHTEFVAINLLGIFAVNLLTSLKYRKSIIFFLLLSSLIPASKGGIVLILSYFLLLGILKFRRLFFAYCLLLLILIAIYIDQLNEFLQANLPYVYWGFFNLSRALVSGSTTDGSVGPRLEDWHIALTYRFHELSMFVGNSAMRAYGDLSYIESTFPNVLFRFGMLGLLFYYGSWLVSCALTLKEYRSFLFALCGAVFIADLTANFSESIKFMYLFAAVQGALIYIGATRSRFL